MSNPNRITKSSVTAWGLKKMMKFETISVLFLSSERRKKLVPAEIQEFISLRTGEVNVVSTHGRCSIHSVARHMVLT